MHIFAQRKMIFDIEQFSKDIKKKRYFKSRTLKYVGKETGVSFAVISRVERGQVPNIETFTKLCTWLGEESNRYFK